jgi:hypothetical protein
MIDLIILRKIVDAGLRLTPKSGNSHPIKTPTTMEIIIHEVSEMRLRFRKIVPM